MDSLNYEKEGNGPTTIILLHGMGGDLAAWDQIRTILHTEPVTIYALDLRGHGKSTRPNYHSEYQMYHLVQDVEYFVENKKLQNVIVVGHCLGGMVAMYLAAKKPTWLKGMLLLNTSYIAPFVGDKRFVRQLLHLMARTTALFMPMWHTHDRRSYTNMIGTSDFSLWRIAGDIRWVSPRAYLFLFANMVRTNAWHMLKDIRTPTHIVHGGRDRIYYPIYAKEIQSAIPHATLAILPGVNHVSVVNAAEQVAEEIKEFMKKLRTLPASENTR